MAQSLITDGESGLLVRNALNSMFTELYGNIVQPIKIVGAVSNFIQGIPANTFVTMLQIRNTLGTATVRIGTTPNGQEILEDTLINEPIFIMVQQYFSGAANLYFTWTSGVGTCNIRIDVIYSYN